MPNSHSQSNGDYSVENVNEAMGMNSPKYGAVAPILLFTAIVSFAPFCFGIAMGYTSPTIMEIKTTLGLDDTQVSLFAVMQTARSENLMFVHRR